MIPDSGSLFGSNPVQKDHILNIKIGKRY